MIRNGWPKDDLNWNSGWLQSLCRKLLDDAEMAFHCSHPVCRSRRVALSGVAPAPIFSRAPYRTTPSAAGLAEAKEAVLDTADGERVIVWHVSPRGEQPIFLYFQGNGGSLRWRDERFRALDR